MKKILVVMVLLGFTSSVYAGNNYATAFCNGLVLSLDDCAVSPSQYSLSCNRASNTMYRVMIKKGYPEKTAQASARLCYVVCENPSKYYGTRTQFRNKCIATVSSQ